MAPTLELERELAGQGFDLIVGFDEVGRGALAGPVMVGAAAARARDLDGLDVPDGVADSKLLTEHKREAMFEDLRSWCAASAVGQASNKEIDEWGISHALGIAALRALNELERELGITGIGSNHDAFLSGSTIEISPDDSSVLPRSSSSSTSADRLSHTASAAAPSPVTSSIAATCDKIIGNSSTAMTPPPASVRVGAILDGPNDYISKAAGTFDAPAVPILPNVTTKVKADQSCALVSAASVIAKVTRDRLMVALSQGNPEYAPYQWQHNKGYGSAAHRAAIAKYGPSPLHRVSWHLV
ncbi:ribonuclease HII [Bifidobacterium sp. ESL0745]|uniref:ribonuclease HII n=1 Tax=Bifidobacterium sp. ESL0745 TaxID=2983226 RepID=UPI0023F79852|nr:ribonuclease HII [Bifidobacterium sp. ESL0745]